MADESKKTVRATVVVRLKGEVLDPQGDAVRRALGGMGFDGVRGVRIGKVVEVEIDEDKAGDREALRARLAKMADAILANPVIEDYEVVVK
jgi:phosphoribosylformylglycinamidine synthase